MSRIYMSGGIYKTCSVCGKRFYVTNIDEYVYRRGCKGGEKIMCSWTCLRAYDKTHERRRWVKD